MINHPHMHPFARLAAGFVSAAAVLCGCGIDPDPGDAISRTARDVAEDAHEAAGTAQDLAENPEKIQEEIERQKDAWPPPRIGK
jgi:hypothetical protein